VAGGAVTITCNYSSSADFGWCGMFEFHDALTTSALDQISITTATSASPTSGATPTTTQTNELVVGFITVAASLFATAPGSGYIWFNQGTAASTTSTTLFGFAMEYATAWAKGAQTATFTLGGSATSIAQVLTFL
jgi:hypothetical protein